MEDDKKEAASKTAATEASWAIRAEIRDRGGAHASLGTLDTAEEA